MKQKLDILYLTLSEPWFSMTARWEKEEEYREIKMYWAVRLCYDAAFTGIIDDPKFKPFDRAELRNGYGNHRPVFQREIDKIFIGTGREEWGAKTGVKYYVIRYKKPIVNS